MGWQKKQSIFNKNITGLPSVLYIGSLSHPVKLNDQLVAAVEGFLSFLVFCQSATVVGGVSQ